MRWFPSVLCAFLAHTAIAKIDSGGGIASLGGGTNHSSIGAPVRTVGTFGGLLKVLYPSSNAMSDSDGDALPDSWEIDNFGLLIEGAAGDPDGDTVSNLSEYLNGTDPTAAPVVGAVPAKVALSRAHTPTLDGFTVSWTDLANETAYHLEHATSANFTGSTLIANIGTNSQNRTLTGLTPGTTYYVRVRATAAGGNGTWSDVQAVQLQSLQAGQTKYLSVPGLPPGASHTVNFTVADVFGSANAAGLASGPLDTDSSVVMLLGASGSTDHRIFFDSDVNEWREGPVSKNSQVIGLGKGFMVKNNTAIPDYFLLVGRVPAVEPGNATVFASDTPAGRLSLVSPNRSTPTSLRFLGFTQGNNTATGLKRSTAPKEADLLLIPDGVGGLRRYHFDGTNWRSGLRTVADPNSVLVPAGGAFFLRRAAASSFEQWKLPTEKISDGLIFHIDAGNTNSYPGSGTAWTDLSGNGYSGNLTSGPTFSATNGGGIVFDGVDDHVETNFLANTGNEFSFGVWCMPTAAGKSSGSDVISKDYSASQPYASWGIDFMPSRRFRFFVADGTSFSPVQSRPQGLNQPYHVFATYKNKVLTAYINGVRVASTTNASDPVYDNSKKVGLGTWLSYPTNNHFTGTIYSASIYNRCLTDAEVLQNYNSQKGRYSIVTDGLVLNLDAGNTDSYPGGGTAWTDTSGKGNNATLFNGATFNGTYGGGIVFDGVNDYATFPTPTEITTSTPQTWEVWCSVVKVSDWGYIIHNNNTNENIGGSFLTIGIESGLNYYFATLNSLNDRITSTVVPSQSTVKQIVVLWNGTHHQMYVDGNLVTSKSLVGSIINRDATTSIGGTYRFATYRPVSGRIYSVKAYNRALSAAEILQNFNALKGRYGL